MGTGTRASVPFQSSILNPQYSILNPQSSILNPQSSILNPQSPILNPQSSILNRGRSYFPTPRSLKFASVVTPGGAGTNTPLTMRPLAGLFRNGFVGKPVT